VRQGTPTPAELAEIASTMRDGSTGHVMLDNVGLVHMQGRVYDPAIGRFLSVDPVVRDVAAAQSWNGHPACRQNDRTLATGELALAIGGLRTAVCRHNRTDGTIQMALAAQTGRWSEPSSAEELDSPRQLTGYSYCRDHDPNCLSYFEDGSTTNSPSRSPDGVPTHSSTP